ncbi:MAG: M15 family metallopeptidase [Marinoscillum sp.]
MKDIRNLNNSEIEAIQSCHDWRDDCPVTLDRLKIVTVEHYDFVGSVQEGQIIVLDLVADAISAVFSELFNQKFPIHQLVPSHSYKGDDLASMEANNSSAFNCRMIMAEGTWSSHSYGVAIDINPHQNPYVLIDHQESTAKIYPSNGTMYLNRHVQKQGMLEPVVDVFKQHGFTEWGGKWDDRLDYHHFQVPWDDISSMI